MTDKLGPTRLDRLAVALRVTAGFLPHCGSLIGEIATEIIPGQRIDRIVAFVRELEQRVAGIEASTLRAQMTATENLPLIEEALVQAARAASDERRRYLAAALANSLTHDELTSARKERLLQILDEVSDVEVLILKSMHNSTVGDDFRVIHRDAVLGPHATMGSPQSLRDAAAVHESYHGHLQQLGLIEGTPRGNIDGAPELDPRTGKVKISYWSVSRLGDLLLRYIDEVTW